MATLDFLVEDDVDYDPSSVADELFLSEVPQQIILDAIKNQFENPFEDNKVDYIQSWIRSYNCSNEEVNTPDEEGALAEAIERFISTVKEYFRHYLSIGFPNIDELSDEKEIEMLHMTYRYFIINIKKNFNAMVINAIDLKEDDILVGLEKKNDVVTVSIPESIPDNIRTIIGNLDIVVKSTLNGDYDIDEFVDLTRTDKTTLETDYVYDMIQTEKLTGNFLPQYIGMVQNADRANIISKTRKRLIKRYHSNSLDDIDD